MFLFVRISSSFRVFSTKKLVVNLKLFTKQINIVTWMSLNKNLLLMFKKINNPTISISWSLVGHNCYASARKNMLVGLTAQQETGRQTY